MAIVLDLIPAYAGFRNVSSAYISLPPFNSSFTSSFSIIEVSGNRRNGFCGNRKLKNGSCRAMVQQTFRGASGNYAKEMERLSAKESLLLAFKDSGGFDSLITGKISDLQRIDVNERITGLERLNPTPRPKTSPFLEGRWNFEWLGAGTSGLLLPGFFSSGTFQRLFMISYLDEEILIIRDATGVPDVLTMLPTPLDPSDIIEPRVRELIVPIQIISPIPCPSYREEDFV
ncbi:hypothetical protein MKX01_011241 [Papaver californicum]|nr:hypothetical protein MKX01_011241 [Papaver californicum]